MPVFTGGANIYGMQEAGVAVLFGGMMGLLELF